MHLINAFREADAEFDSARQANDAPATAETRAAREINYNRALENLDALAAAIKKTQAQIHLIEKEAEVGNITPPPTEGNWTRATKPRLTRKWILTRQPDKHKRASCGVCHEPIQVDGLRVQLQGQLKTRCHYRHLTCLATEWDCHDTIVNMDSTQVWNCLLYTSPSPRDSTSS
eukprot:3118212-Prorocentrum_lima.AAC.1